MSVAVPELALRRAELDDVARLTATTQSGLAAISDIRGGPVVQATTAPLDIEAEITSLLSSPNALVMLGTVNGAICGQAIVSKAEVGGGELAITHQLWVDPLARTVGLGRLLMSGAVEWASEHNCVGIDATALPGDRETKNFFESFGLVARQLTVHRAL